MAVQISHSIYTKIPETAAVRSSEEASWRGVHFLRRERNYAGQRIWARGFFVDTVGRDTETIRKYIAEQEMEDRRLDQLEMPEITREKRKHLRATNNNSRFERLTSPSLRFYRRSLTYSSCLITTHSELLTL